MPHNSDQIGFCFGDYELFAAETAQLDAQDSNDSTVCEERAAEAKGAALAEEAYADPA